MNDGSQKRKQLRLLVKMEVVINSGIKSHALDISAGGMFLYTHIPFPKNEILDLCFTLEPGEAPIVCKAQVRFVQPGVGVGVIFFAPDNILMEHIHSFIERHKDDHPLGDSAGTVDGRKKILIVDESRDVRMSYRNKLVLLNASVREAADCAEALKTLSTEVSDLILLDVAIRGMGATRFMQVLRANEAWRDVKVLILSKGLPSEELQRICALGVCEIIPKMTTPPTKLADIVKRTLGL